MRTLLTTTVAIWIAFAAMSQDTVSIMYYNILNYPNINSSRITYLQTIADYVKPDILVVNELTSSQGADNILNQALNTGGVTYYNAVNYVQGPDDVNMLYYNSNLLGLVSQREIATSLRNINEYVLYYKSPGLTALSDTAYLYVYAAHLKAGSTASDENERASETAILKANIIANTEDENVIVGGDFNIYTSNEQAYFNLTNVNQGNLHDPVGAGSYHNNSSFAPYFTQSTRTTSFDGGATGGMDDRFDMILCSQDMVTGVNGAQLIPSSYHAIGQDGLRWNSSLITPTNNSVPSNVSNALYYMSDHLPIYMEFKVGGSLKVESNEQIKTNIFPNPANEEVSFNCSHVVNSWTIVDLQGRLALSGASNTTSHSIDVSMLNAGIYLINLNTETGLIQKKIVIE